MAPLHLSFIKQTLIYRTLEMFLLGNICWTNQQLSRPTVNDKYIHWLVSVVFPVRGFFKREIKVNTSFCMFSEVDWMAPLHLSLIKQPIIYKTREISHFVAQQKTLICFQGTFESFKTRIYESESTNSLVILGNLYFISNERFIKGKFTIDFLLRLADVALNMRHFIFNHST